MKIRTAASDMGTLYDEHVFYVKVKKRGKRAGKDPYLAVACRLAYRFSVHRRVADNPLTHTTFPWEIIGQINPILHQPSDLTSAC
jgi:hypothetical protein